MNTLFEYHELNNRVNGPIIENRVTTGQSYMDDSSSDTYTTDEGQGANTNRRSSLLDDFADPSTEFGD